ncbi:MAG TPA: response regulator [Ktedonobacteraceae bacterium]|nr:response regulator [Ktedonobacteraceae bacterium]
MNRQGRILIVDDEEQWRKELVETLERGGFQVDAVSRASEALARLGETSYHMLVLDIRLVQADRSNIEGIDLLGELSKDGLYEATKVIMLSAFGTKEHMRTSFRKYKVVDFLSKEDFDNQVFLENVRQIFSEKVDINLSLEINWQEVSGPEQIVPSLEMDGISDTHDPAFQSRIAIELVDLLCRLFYQAESILVRPMTAGHSGTGVLWVQPFYVTGGGRAVVVKFGNIRKIEEEYRNFGQFIQPFIGGGRNTVILNVRRTSHLKGIIYSLVGAANNNLEDFGSFYRQSSVPEIEEALDRLFEDTCGAWYASPGNLRPHKLTEDYQQLLNFTPEKLEQGLSDLVESVRGEQKLYFKSLRGKHAYTNPLLATEHLTLVQPTYICTTHGDFNQHNILVDNSGNTWLIDFLRTGRGHILRDVSALDSVVRFQLLASGEATLEERLKMEKALCSIERFSQVEQLADKLPTKNNALNKAYKIVIHLRKLARKLVGQNPGDDISEYFIALLYHAMNTLRYRDLSVRQREHALLCASLLVDRLGLKS